MQLYNKRASRSLTTLAFWKTGVALAVVHGTICFFIPYYAISTSGRHNITDVWSLGKVAFVSLLGVVTVEMALVVRYWTLLFTIFILLSYFLVYPFMLIFPLVGEPQLNGCRGSAGQQAVHWQGVLGIAVGEATPPLLHPHGCGYPHCLPGPHL